MATDRSEQARRGQSSQPRATTKHPFIAIEHRIFDSPAFADLKPNAKVVLFSIARQSKRDNNGQLQATFSWCKRFGLGSEHTLKDSIGQLISHGFIYRTRSHGANGQWACYALTWLPITKKDGLFLAGFVPNAWRDWQSSNKKTSPQKVQESTGRKCSFTPESPAESAGTLPAKTAEYESLLPCIGVETRKNRQRKPMTSPLAIRLSLAADRGRLRLVA